MRGKNNNMSSTYSPYLKRLMYKYLPFLFYKCPGGNYHWRWDRFCICNHNCNGENMSIRISKNYWHLINN